MKDRRVVHYYPRAITGDGGVTNAMWEWAEAQTEAGLQVAVLHRPGAPTRHVSSSVTTVAVPHRGGVQVRRTLRPIGLAKFLRPNDLLILHSGWRLHNITAGKAARSASVPYLVVPHGSLNPRIRFRRRHLKAIWEPWEHSLISKSVAVHVFFQEEVDEVHAFSPSTKVIVAPTPAAVSTDTWQGGGGYVAWLGRYDIEHKGLDLLMDTVGSLPPDDRPRFVLHGPDAKNSAAEVSALACSRGVNDSIEVHGPIAGAQKEAFLRNADCYFHPSRWEAYGLTITEALSRGVPVVVNRDICIARSLAEARAAVVCAPTASALSAGIKQALTDGKALSERGRRFVSSSLARSSVMESWIDQVEEVLSEAHRDNS